MRSVCVVVVVALLIATGTAHIVGECQMFVTRTGTLLPCCFCNDRVIPTGTTCTELCGLCNCTCTKHDDCVLHTFCSPSDVCLPCSMYIAPDKPVPIPHTCTIDDIFVM